MSDRPRANSLTLTFPPLSSLTTKLPFEDDEFDHVHVSMIAKGVPENKVKIMLKSCNFYTEQLIVGKPLRGECGAEADAISGH